MAETKSEKIEREYTIPLRRRYQHVARYKKTPKAVKTIKEFLAKHMKIYDRDLNKIKIDKQLNEYLWFRGIKNPPHKVKIKAVKDGDVVRVELVNLTDKLKFKKAREEKREAKARELVESKKSMMQKAKEQMQGKKEDKDKNKDGVDDKIEEKEKKEAVKEEGKKAEKELAKKEKKTTKVKEPKQEKAEIKEPQAK